MPQADGSFYHYTEAGGIEKYSGAGYISSVIKHNVGWTFTYTAAGSTYPARVTHTSGRYVEFTWTNGQLTAVRDPAGNYYGYAYSANQFGAGLHRLASSSQPGTPATTTTYHYEISDTTALTGKSFNGVRYSKFTYNPNGYATSSEHTGQEKYTFAYTPAANGLLTVVATNPLGKKTTTVYKNGDPTTVTGHPSTYCPLSSYALTEYDSNGYPAMRSDFNDNKTAYTYNAKGQLLTRIEAYGTPQARTTQYEWWGPGASNQLMRETVVGVSETLYNYDALSRLERVTVTNRSANGVPNQTRDTWITYATYDQAGPGGSRMPGMLKSVTVDGPLAGTSDTVTQNYDNQGNLTSVINGLGHATTYSGHNGLGQPGRVTGVNGAITDYTYDARGRVTKVRTYPNGSTAADTTYTYLGNGLLDSITRPDGQLHRYQYDVARRVTTESELEAGGTYAQIEYAYNAASLPTSVTVGRSTTPPGSSIVGNVDGVTTVPGVGLRIRGWACSTYMNSSINVHLYLGGPAGSGTAIGAYTANLSSEPAVASACQASGTAYRFEIPVTSAMRQQYGDYSIYIHGISTVGASNLLINGSGNFRIPPPVGGGGGGGCNPICQDPQSSPGETSAIAEAPIVSATSVNSTDTYKGYTDYDELGRVRGQRGNNGQNVGYTYDLNGNVKTITDSLGKVTTLTYDALDRVIQSKDPLNAQPTKFEYNAADQITKVTDPRGKITTYTYDGFGQLWKQVSPDTGTTTFQYDAVGQLTQMTRSSGSATTYAYDGLGRLTSTTAGGQSMSYNYDTCLNGKGRLCDAYAPSSVFRYQYETDGRIKLRREILTAAAVQTDYWTRYYYDAIGRLNSLTYPNGQAVGYGYASGKLKTMTVNIGGVVTNVVTDTVYQPFGAVIPPQIS